MTKKRLGGSDYIENGCYFHSCGKMLIRIDKNASLEGVHCWCYKCHKEVELEKIVNGKIVKDFKVHCNEQNKKPNERIEMG